MTIRNYFVSWTGFIEGEKAFFGNSVLAMDRPPQTMDDIQRMEREIQTRALDLVGTSKPIILYWCEMGQQLELGGRGA